MKYNKKSHSVYLLTYHIVFVTKYRKPVISDEIGDFMKNHAEYLCGRFDGEVLSIETDRDHMHLLVSLPPDVAPSKLVASLKTQLSKEVRNYYKEEIEKHEKTAMDKGLVYAVCLPSSQIVRFTNNPDEEGIRFTFPKKHVFIDGNPITDKQIQNPDLMKGCTYHLVQLGAHIGVDIKTENNAKKTDTDRVPGK